MSLGMGTSRFVVTEYDLAVMRSLLRAARKSFRALSVSSSLEAINEVFRLGVALVRIRCVGVGIGALLFAAVVCVPGEQYPRNCG